MQNLFEEDGTPRDAKMEQKVVKFLDEYEWYAGALAEARKKGVPF